MGAFILIYKIYMMSIQNNVLLCWTDFENKLKSAISDVRAHSELFDVTLGCPNSANGEFLKAHKVVLAASSSYFRHVFRMKSFSQHCGNTFVLLTGVKCEEFSMILDFIYRGEVNVPSSRLNSFLSVAEDLKIDGLTRLGNDNFSTLNHRAADNTESCPNFVAAKPDVGSTEPYQKDSIEPTVELLKTQNINLTNIERTSSSEDKLAAKITPNIGDFMAEGLKATLPSTETVN